MRRLLALALAAVVLLAVLVPGDRVAAQSASERITSYRVDIAVQPDTSLRIIEEIAYDFGTA